MTDSALVTAARARQARSCTHFFSHPVKGMTCRDCVIEEAEAQIEALLRHLPQNWGDHVVEGEIMLLVDADAIEAARP